MKRRWLLVAGGGLLLVLVGVLLGVVGAEHWRPVGRKPMRGTAPPVEATAMAPVGTPAGTYQTGDRKSVV